MKTIPFYLLLVMTFGLASIEKIAGGKVPDWFLEQFRGSILDVFPYSLKLGYGFISMLELVTALTLILGLARKEFLKENRQKKFLQLGAFLAQITFIILGFGQRLTHKYEEAGSLFFYAILTYLASQVAFKYHEKNQ